MNSQSNPRITFKGQTESSPFAREVYRADPPRDPREDVLEEIAALRAEVRTEVRALRSALNRPPKQNAALTNELAALRAALDELVPAPKRGDAFAALIRARGIEGTAVAFLDRLGKSRDKGRSPSERLAGAIASLVAVTAWPIAHNEPTLIALVGPAGVGKTTTAAKLGARALRAKKTVAFVSCDGYRVGALDQLRRYAELMECEFHAVTAPEEFLTVISEIRADVIIVDTSGRAAASGSVEAMLGDDRLRDVHASRRRVEVMLCMPAALRASDAGRVARNFASTLPTSLCITKLDETDAPSALVHGPVATQLPISTLCFGQRVPEDIGSATIEEVVVRMVPVEEVTTAPTTTIPAAPDAASAAATAESTGQTQ